LPFISKSIAFPKISPFPEAKTITIPLFFNSSILFSRFSDNEEPPQLQFITLAPNSSAFEKASKK
jgi:hypothetical protein